jgi:hypothetical protein
MRMLYVIIVLLLIVPTGPNYGQTGSALGPGRKYTSVERMSPDRLRSVHEDLIRYHRSRQHVQLKTDYNDYRAILHAHAEDSPHTGGGRDEMLKAAKAAGVRIIMLTDHRQADRDFINDSWRGIRDGVLFIPGAEAEGFLIYPIRSISGKGPGPREELISTVKEGGGNIFLSHVEDKLDWRTDGLDGLEIYNHHTDVKDETEFNRWLRGALSDLKRLREIEQALALYPQEVFASQQDYLSPIIKKWDRDSMRRRLTAIAANDCHHNQVYTITAMDEKTVEVSLITSRPVTTRLSIGQVPGVEGLLKGRRQGEVIARLDFDPYERSFRYISTHILAKSLNERGVRDALRQGHAYVAHDWLCDPTGFAFIARTDGSRAVSIMGDEVNRRPGLKIEAETPVAATLKLFHNGQERKSVVGRNKAGR